MGSLRQSFGKDDIDRWVRVYSRDPEFYLSKIDNGEIERGRTLSELSRSHEYLALIAIARAQYGKALGHFAAAGGAWAYLLERYLAGEEIAPDLLERCSSLPLLLALAADDERQIDRLAGVYEQAFPEARTGKNKLHWMAIVDAALASGKVRLASDRLAAPPPDLSSASKSFFDALLHRNEDEFEKHFLSMVENWRKRIRSERLGRFPDAVCNHHQIGNIRLAERLWGHRPNVDLAAAKIPPEIFDAVAEPVEGML